MVPVRRLLGLNFVVYNKGTLYFRTVRADEWKTPSGLSDAALNHVMLYSRDSRGQVLYVTA